MTKTDLLKITYILQIGSVNDVHRKDWEDEPEELKWKLGDQGISKTKDKRVFWEKISQQYSMLPS